MNTRNGAAAVPSGISYLIGRLERLLRRRLGEAISHLGLTVQQYTALAVLGARGPLSNARLAERSFVTPQTANEMIKAMEERGWVERSPDPSHGRIIQLRLTRKGREMLDKAHAAVAELEDVMLAAIAPRDRQRFSDYLKTSIHTLNLALIDTSEQ
jgi:DNA-binding MarR family transcriptional regulator